MEIRVKLMGTLSSKTPAGGTLVLADGATIEQALAALGVPPDRVQVVTVNGKPQRDKSQALADDDELVVLAPVGGG